VKPPLPMIFTCEVALTPGRRIGAAGVRELSKIERLYRKELTHHTRGGDHPLLMRYARWLAMGGGEL